MSKLKALQPFKEPPPREREACVSCETFAPECLVPVEDAAVPMCWLCAHHVVEHGCAPHRAHTAECECEPHQIYPNRPHPAVLNGTYVERPQYMGKDSIRFDVETHAIQPGVIRFPHGDGVGRGVDVMHMYNQKTGCMDTIVNGELVDSTPIAPVRENGPRRKSS